MYILKSKHNFQYHVVERIGSITLGPLSDNQFSFGYQKRNHQLHSSQNLSNFLHSLNAEGNTHLTFVHFHNKFPPSLYLQNNTASRSCYQRGHQKASRMFKVLQVH